MVSQAAEQRTKCYCFLKYYLFRTLPIPMHTYFFMVMQKQLPQFIWAGSKVRCSPQIQRKHRLMGGMGIPVLIDYYMASILDQLKYWFSRPPLKPGCQLEMAWMDNKSPLSLLIPNVLNFNENILNILLFWPLFRLDHTCKKWLTTI